MCPAPEAHGKGSSRPPVKSAGCDDSTCPSARCWLTKVAAPGRSAVRWSRREGWWRCSPTSAASPSWIARPPGSSLSHCCAGSSSDWNTPRYLLADDEHVYAIGGEIRAFLLDNPETPLCRIPACRESVDGKPLANAGLESLELQGRVQLVEGALIVPNRRRSVCHRRRERRGP